MNFRKTLVFFIMNFLAKQIEAKFSEKSKYFRIFREQTKWEKMRKFSRVHFFFAKRFFLFAANPVLIKYNNIYKFHPDIHSRNS